MTPRSQATGKHSKSTRIGRETATELQSWMSAVGLELHHADGVEVEVPRPAVDLAPEVHVDAPLNATDTEATAQLDQATIQLLRAAAAKAKTER